MNLQNLKPYSKNQPMNPYREQMVIAIQDMIIARHNLFHNIINLSLKGELLHLEGFVDDGEPYKFKMNHFRGIEDPNVQALIKICDTIENKVLILMEENDIDYNEVNFEI